MKRASPSEASREQAPTRPALQEFMTAPSPGALGRQAGSGWAGRHPCSREGPLSRLGLCLKEEGGKLPWAPLRPPQPRPLAHQCFSSSEPAPAASRGCAWRRGPRGPSGCFPEHPRPLKAQRRQVTSDPQARPQHLLQLSPTLTPQDRGFPGRRPSHMGSVRMCRVCKTPSCPAPHRPHKAYTESPTCGALTAVRGKAVDLWGGQGVPYGASSKDAQVRAARVGKPKAGPLGPKTQNPQASCSQLGPPPRRPLGRG